MSEQWQELYNPSVNGVPATSLGQHGGDAPTSDPRGASAFRSPTIPLASLEPQGDGAVSSPSGRASQPPQAQSGNPGDIRFGPGLEDLVLPRFISQDIPPPPKISSGGNSRLSSLQGV